MPFGPGAGQLVPQRGAERHLDLGGRPGGQRVDRAPSMESKTPAGADGIGPEARPTAGTGGGPPRRAPSVRGGRSRPVPSIGGSLAERCPSAASRYGGYRHARASRRQQEHSARRSGPAPAGADQPRQECHRCHARRRRASLRSERHGGWPGRDQRARHGTRHSGRRPCAHVRALLHHQGRGQGYRDGIASRQRDRQVPEGHHRVRNQDGCRYDVLRPPTHAVRGPLPGEGER